jgi:hypothetical protein
VILLNRMPNNKKKTLAKLTLTFFLIVQFYGLFYGLSAISPRKLESANLSTVSDTISNNRLSFRGQVSGAHAAGAAAITLQTTAGSMGTANTSSGSASLMGNESLQVGVNNAPVLLKTIESDSRIVLATGITNAVDDGNPVFSTASAIHTVTFTPLATVANGAFRVLIPATSTGANDGIPDKNGFDFTAVAPTVACTGGSNMTFVAGTATASALSVGSQAFHSFECRYSGTGDGGGSPAAVTMTIGTAGGSKLINPSPASSSRYPGQADTYTFRVRQTNGISQTYTVVDESLGTIGVIEAVKVTATVAPILTFTITGIDADSGSYCGVTRDSASPDSTVNEVPFGTVSTTAFTDAAQLLTVSTNASGGYSVTASESAALTALNVTGTPTIPDTTCQVTPCTVSTPQTWTVPATYKGFGYGLQDVAGDAVLAGIEYTVGWRPFGLTAQQIMTDTTTVDADQAYVCYRVVVSGSQQAGDYENYIVYIATATF